MAATLGISSFNFLNDERLGRTEINLHEPDVVIIDSEGNDSSEDRDIDLADVDVTRVDLTRCGINLEKMKRLYSQFEHGIQLRPTSLHLPEVDIKMKASPYYIIYYSVDGKEFDGIDSLVEYLYDIGNYTGPKKAGMKEMEAFVCTRGKNKRWMKLYTLFENHIKAKHKNTITSSRSETVIDISTDHDITSNDDTSVCCICLDAKKTWLNMPCKHMISCQPCGKKSQTRGEKCAMCRRVIKNAFNVYC